MTKKNKKNLEIMLYISIFVLCLYNILLELHNYKENVMKKSLLAIIISVLVIATTLVWLLSMRTIPKLIDMVQFGIITIVVGFGLYFGLNRLQSEKRGEPSEDEFSKKILQKAASSAFFFSLYLWLGIGYLSDKTRLETHSQIGAGILGMAVLFAGSWIFYRIKGIKND
jgi:hypothetical protein